MKLNNIKAVVFDLNGTLYQRGILVEGANETIQKLRNSGLQMSFVTNTDSRKTIDVHSRLKKMGLDIKLEELYTPVVAVKTFIENNKGKGIYPLVHDDVKEELSELVIFDESNPDCVVIGDFCDKVSYDEINKVFRMIKGGAEIIALSKTLWYKDSDGDSINTGAFVKMFEMACDTSAQLMGKPSEGFFNMALQRMETTADEALFIGDDVLTDVLGAQKLGAVSVLVKTGVYSEEVLNETEKKPDYILENVNELLELLNI